MSFKTVSEIFKILPNNKNILLAGKGFAPTPLPFTEMSAKNVSFLDGNFRVWNIFAELNTDYIYDHILLNNHSCYFKHRAIIQIFALRTNNLHIKNWMNALRLGPIYLKPSLDTELNFHTIERGRRSRDKRNTIKRYWLFISIQIKYFYEIKIN